MTSDVNNKRMIALAEYREKLANGEIEKAERKTLKEKWEDDRTSLRKSISYMCYQCMGGKSSDNIVGDIRNCTSNGDGNSTLCPLYYVRAYK